MNSTIGGNLRHLRRRAGRTQAEVAKRAGTSQAWICRIETGDANPTLASLRRIARALDVQVVDLLQRCPEQARPT
jgi:transcriptional regulator with XRE-family HTH domain